MPELYSLLGPPYVLLIFGVISLGVGVVSTCMGVTVARYGRVIYRAKEPRQFWEIVATFYLIGICFIAYFLHKAYAPPN